MDVLGYSQAHHSVVVINPFPGSPSSTFPWTLHVYTTLWVSVYPPHIGHCGERDDSGGGLGDDNKGNIHITNAINLELPCGFLRRAHTAIMPEQHRVIVWYGRAKSFPGACDRSKWNGLRWSNTHREITGIPPMGFDAQLTRRWTQSNGTAVHVVDGWIARISIVSQGLWEFEERRRWLDGWTDGEWHRLHRS